MNGLELLELRTKYNLTQDKLAEMLRMTRKTINIYETKGNIPASKQILFEQFFKNLEAKIAKSLPIPQQYKKLKKLFISLKGRLQAGEEEKYKDYEKKLQKGESMVTISFLDSLCKDFPDINKEWVLYNKGSMFLSDSDFFNQDIKHSISKIKTKNGTNEVIPVPEDSYIMVEYIDLATSAGLLGIGDISVLPEEKTRLIPREYKKGNYLVVRVSGDSMDDGSKRSLSDGDEILIKQYTDPIEYLPIRTKLFVVNTNNGSIVKQITKIDKSAEQIICHSFNEKYPDQVVELSEIIQLFEVEKIVNSKIRF